MPTFEPWDIIKVPFPYTDRPVRQRRPDVGCGCFGDFSHVARTLKAFVARPAVARGLSIPNRG